jgi:hypothetical protein
MIQQIKKKLVSKVEKLKLLIFKNDEVCVIKNRYKKLKIKNNAPNCVQKNIKYAASIQRRVFANLYKIKKDGINNIS